MRRGGTRHESSFQDGPDAFDAVGVDVHAHVLFDAVVHHVVHAEHVGEVAIAAVLIGIDGGASVDVFFDRALHVEFAGSVDRFGYDVFRRAASCQ